MSTSIESTTEIRKIPRQYISVLGNILEDGNCWHDIMGLVPSFPWIPETAIPKGNSYARKYNSEDIILVSKECSRDGRTGFEVLIEEWGSSGQIRPKVIDLINLFNEAGFVRASIYLKDVIVEDSFYSLLSKFDSNIFNYNDLKTAVSNGNKIGEGGFGAVYEANFKIGEEFKSIAIKFLQDSDQGNEFNKKLFQNEIEILSKCNHENIIRLEGYSYYKNDLALVYPFMENGSLYDRISLANNSAPIPWKLRLKIALGTAKGIVYLHTAFSPPMIHRDVKSPNILLNKTFVPKLGDFGFVHRGGRGLSTSTIVQTSVIIGTPMYMCPHAFRGDVSVKLDTFSYGIVILELLTGLNFFDKKRECPDILSHVQDFEDDVLELLDSAAGEWDTDVARKLFEFAELCSEYNKRRRPNMVDALSHLNQILNETNLDD